MSLLDFLGITTKIAFCMYNGTGFSCIIRKKQDHIRCHQRDIGLLQMLGESGLVSCFSVEESFPKITDNLLKFITEDYFWSIRDKIQLN